MKILFNFKDVKNNPTEQVKAFIKHILNNKGNVEVISPEKLLGEGADYFVTGEGVLIEATYLMDREELARSSRWAITANTLSKQIKKHSKFALIRGLYSISTPERFGLKTSQLKNAAYLETKVEDAASTIIEAIIQGKSTVIVFGSKLELEKVNEADNGVYFATMGEVKSISVANIFHENLKNKFARANKQLSFPKINNENVRRRILLIVNQYKLLTFDWDIFDGISYSFTELTKEYKNIDEIWFQVGDDKTGYDHKLLYDKSLFEQFESMNFFNMKKQDYELFAKWFSSLEKMDEEKKENLIKALEILLKDRSPDEIFPDPGTRIEMVRYGRWLAENNKHNKADWLVKQFLNDPDPTDPPTNDSEDDGNKLHESVKNATKPDMHAIYTVMGHLAWTVQMLTLKKDFLKNAYEFTQSVLKKTKNFYIVYQWVFPLIEISNRRFWLKEIDENLYKDFKKLCFSLLDSYAKYPDIAAGLVRVFYHFRNLTTNEAKLVLEKLENASDYEALLIYFAIYRERHFTEAKYPSTIRNYNAKYAKEKLNKIILSADKKYMNTRSGIAWNIWKILSENDTEFTILSPLVDKFLSTPYDNHLFHHIERIIEDNVDKHTTKCIGWFIKLLQAVDTYLAANPDDARNVWLSTETGGMLAKIGKKNPEKLSGLIKILYGIWMKGAYVGGIASVFGSYKSVEDERQRAEIKKVCEDLYLKMKAVNPKLEEVIWEEK
ncbi:MAG: hypothetical protein WAX66_01570 [Patescibacteria group bacterium]